MKTIPVVASLMVLALTASCATTTTTSTTWVDPNAGGYWARPGSVETIPRFGRVAKPMLRRHKFIGERNLAIA